MEPNPDAEAPAAPEAPAEGAPAPKPKRARLDQNGMERPQFLLDFPEDGELEPLIVAFEAGNYRKVRNEAPGVAERAGDPDVRAAALELLRRIEPDPLVKYLLAIAFALLIFLTIWAYRK